MISRSLLDEMGICWLMPIDGDRMVTVAGGGAEAAAYAHVRMAR